MEELEITPQVETVAEAPDPREERISQLEAQLAESAKTIRSLEKNVSRHKGTAEALAELKNEFRLVKATLEDQRNGVEYEQPVQSAYQRELKAIEAERAKATPDEPDPEMSRIVKLANKICHDNNWDTTSPQYKKAVELGPDEGLEYLLAESHKRAAATAREQAELERKKAIKESGGTASGPGPSAGNTDLDELRRRFIENSDDPKIAREWYAVRDSYYAKKNRGG
jgi:uncharacterized coiled-coil protein SlyX